MLRATLPNGLRIVIVPDRLAPVVSTEINYLVGSNDAPAGFPGTAHAPEHMMFRGTAGLDRDQLSELGSLLGGGYNADTTETVTQYFYEVPRRDLGVALKSEVAAHGGVEPEAGRLGQGKAAPSSRKSRAICPPRSIATALQAILFNGTPTSMTRWAPGQSSIAPMPRCCAGFMIAGTRPTTPSW